MDENMRIADGLIVAMDYTLRVDGEIMDTSDGGEPIEFLQGANNIIRGLENQIYDMKVGDSKEVTVPPKDGYGEIDDDAYGEISRQNFPAHITLEKGIELQVRDEDGESMYARIDSFDEDNVHLDFNHPLAGKELHFSVRIADIRQATDEEREHGHVHHGHEH